jgi:hypothetical protein
MTPIARCVFIYFCHYAHSGCFQLLPVTVRPCCGLSWGLCDSSSSITRVGLVVRIFVCPLDMLTVVCLYSCTRVPVMGALWGHIAR